jgi:hypothetical protein
MVISEVDRSGVEIAGRMRAFLMVCGVHPICIYIYIYVCVCVCSNIQLMLSGEDTGYALFKAALNNKGLGDAEQKQIGTEVGDVLYVLRGSMFTREFVACYVCFVYVV